MYRNFKEKKIFKTYFKFFTKSEVMSDFDDSFLISVFNKSKMDKIRFGNKYVDKNSPEYLKERQKNTVAVKKSRNKKKKEILESKNELKIKIEENQVLINNILKVKDEVDKLVVTLSRIDSNFILPNNIEIALKNMDTEMKNINNTYFFKD
jgi:hypothetical protein